jgi:hypothetical protein
MHNRSLAPNEGATNLKTQILERPWFDAYLPTRTQLWYHVEVASELSALVRMLLKQEIREKLEKRVGISGSSEIKSGGRISRPKSHTSTIARNTSEILVRSPSLFFLKD